MRKRLSHPGCGWHAITGDTPSAQPDASRSDRGGSRLYRAPMRSVGWLACVVIAAGMAAGTVLYGQGGGVDREGGWVPGGAGFDRDRVAMTLELLGLTKQEAAAALKAGEAKWKARQALEQERNKLRALADDVQAKDNQLREGIAAYTQAMNRYRAIVQSEDAALAKQLSLRSRAHCLAAGVLDNGLGPGGRPRGEGGRNRAGFPEGGRGMGPAR